MLQGESTNGGCSMEQAKGMRVLSEWCVAFLGMAPRGRLQNVTCEQRFEGGEKVTHMNIQNRGFMLWRRPEPGLQSRDMSNICEEQQGGWNLRQNAKRRQQDFRSESHAGHWRHRCSSSGWGGGHWGALSRGTAWSLDGRRPGKGPAKARNDGGTGQSGRREGHGVSS